MIHPKAIQALRLSRQFLDHPANEAEYCALFRQLSPVFTPYWCCPGDPPRLVFRAGFDEVAFISGLRARREVVKGRFQNGGIAYVFAEELELFASVYRKDPNRLSYDEMQLLDLLEHEGPMNIHLMKESTGLLTKQITPLLHRLQEKFLVFEDQTDCEGDRAWYLFSSEWPGLDCGRYSKEEGIRELIVRFIRANVWAGAEMIRSYYRLPVKEIKSALHSLADSGILLEQELSTEDDEGLTGYILSEDKTIVSEDLVPSKSVFVLHRNDFLVKSNEHWLKTKFQSEDYDILQYILLDGVFQGVVLGHFKNGPFIIEDIKLNLPAGTAMARRSEIIAAVGLVNDPVASPVRRFMGEPL